MSGASPSSPSPSSQGATADDITVSTEIVEFGILPEEGKEGQATKDFNIKR